MNNTLRNFLLSTLSGLLLLFAWPVNGVCYLSFVAFIPLLFIEAHYASSVRSFRFFLGWSYWTFFIWNAGVTWWVWNASNGGAVMAIIANSLIMALVLAFAHSISKKLNTKLFPILFVLFWISFEKFHMNWDLTWPWLTLGNVFSASTRIIQWYEYTGVFGGSLWVLLLNIAGYNLLTNKLYKNRWYKINLLLLLSLIVIPVLISLLLLTKEYNYNNKVNVTIVQPNIDPYGEKFSGNFAEQLTKMFSLAETHIDSSTDVLIFPETALTEDLWENTIHDTYSVHFIDSFIKTHPRLKILIGASTAKYFDAGEALSETARKFKNADEYYDAYNTALYFNGKSAPSLYHKSKLVPGVEKMPFPFLFKPFENLAIDMGGTTGSLGVQDNREVFGLNDGIPGLAPVICYESIYGSYVSEYLRNGASLICIITNDGWWGNTPGYKQHLSYASLRAIETRKYIARSANTGISCFIEPNGTIVKPTDWWTPAVISSTLYYDNNLTFYTRFGDYIAFSAILLSAVFVLFYLLMRYRLYC